MESSAILALAYRDVLKFVRDPARLVATFIFPLLFIGILGGSLQANLGRQLGYNFLTYTFTGVFAQSLFQSASLGIVSLIADRENDFSQEIFVSPISRYTIIIGKIVGESLVALIQGLAIVVFGLVVGVHMTLAQIAALLPAGIVVCLIGGAFGVVILSNISNQRTANQIFPFIFFPQFFLAGVFNPVQVLPWYLDILSRIAPLRYAVDFTRAVFYAGHPDYPRVILHTPPLALGALQVPLQGAAFNLTVMTAMFLVFLVIGTSLFVRNERNR